MLEGEVEMLGKDDLRYPVWMLNGLSYINAISLNESLPKMNKYRRILCTLEAFNQVSVS